MICSVVLIIIPCFIHLDCLCIAFVWFVLSYTCVKCIVSSEPHITWLGGGGGWVGVKN